MQAGINITKENISYTYLFICSCTQLYDSFTDKVNWAYNVTGTVDNGEDLSK